MSTFRYRLNSAPFAYNDGSGCIGHDIDAQYSDNGDWMAVPGRHKTILVPSSMMKTINDMPDGTGPQKQAKTAAYKQALATNLDTQNVPIIGWSTAQMQILVDANKAAATEAGRANVYITVTLGQSYPVSFSL